jgi:hypothetical protein
MDTGVDGRWGDVGGVSMRQFQDAVHVDASPERVWSWLAGLVDHYTEWHPDHVSAYWVTGKPNEVGSVLEAVECVGGRREKLRFEMTDIDVPHVMRYRILGPHSLILPGGAFSIDSDGDSSVFTASIQYRFGGILDRLFARRAGALRAHMREEGANLKRLVEASS